MTLASVKRWRETSADRLETARSEGREGAIVGQRCTLLYKVFPVSDAEG